MSGAWQRGRGSGADRGWLESKLVRTDRMWTARIDVQTRRTRGNRKENSKRKLRSWRVSAFRRASRRGHVRRARGRSAATGHRPGTQRPPASDPAPFGVGASGVTAAGRPPAY